MSRRRAAERRDVLPDALHGDIVLTKFINSVMRDGKKAVAEGIVYGALDRIRDTTGQDPIGVFHLALNAVRPAVEVRSRRIGGATYQVPVEVSPDRQQALAIRWLIGAARAPLGKPPWCSASRGNSWMPRGSAALPSRNVKTPIGWRTRTRRFRTTAGSGRSW